MPVIPIHVGRIDFGECSGMIYSFNALDNQEIEVAGHPGFIRRITTMQVQTPEGYVLEPVHDVNPHGDTGFTRMVLDADTTAQYGNGRVYMRAARIVERMRGGDDRFARVG